MNNEKHFQHMLSRWFLSAVTAIAISPALSAQTAIEYFWNEDPGIGHGTIVYQTGYDNSGSEFSIDTSNLKQGLNLLGLRANQHGKWSPTSYRLVAIRDDSSEDWKAEYFWNDDPGIGHGTQISASCFDENGSEFSIDTTNLPNGINLLGLRVNCQGQSSYTSYHMVAVGMDTPDKWEAEYFWNEDPGIGKATSISLSAPDEDNFMSMTLDTSHLHPGLNILGIRANSGSILSSTRTYIINISPAGDDKCVVEYFWDNDPGCGKANKIANEAIEAGTLVEVDIPYEGLAPGAHTLGIRSLSSYGWSPTYTSQVFIAGEKGPGCTYAEYFWGEDPGYGNGTPIEITPGDEVTVDDLTIDFPSEVAEEYVLSFRSKSDNGWSTTVTKIIPHLYVEGIVIEADTTIIARGTSMQLRSIVTPSDAFDNRVTWSSSDDNIISVDQEGNVTAKAAGKAIVTATAVDGAGTTGSIELNVIVPVEGITIEPAELNISVNDSHQLIAKVMPEDATHTDVTWSSDNPEVATIDEDGIVTAHSKGTATITVNVNDAPEISASCIINVLPPIPESISISETEISVEIGNSFQLFATVYPAEAPQEIEWSSENPEIATVNEDGVITAMKEGETEIWICSKEYPSIIAGCFVKVTDDSAVPENSINSIRVYVDQNDIRIEGKDSETIVEVLDIEGRMLRKSYDSVIKGLDHGVYIVIVGNERIKVRI